jgi:Mg2+ and Co2+ transporter CorA
LLKRCYALEITMTEALADIISQLERQRTAIEKALSALREIEGSAAPASIEATASVKRRGRPSASSKRAGGQRRRWAAKKAAENAPAVAEPEAAPAPRKVRFTAAGRQKLADAMKRRWAVKRAAAKKAAKKSS